MASVTEQIIAELKVAYWMELETVTSDLANSVNLDGVRAAQIKKTLQADVLEELTYAQILARRIKTPGGRVPGSAEFPVVRSSSAIRLHYRPRPTQRTSSLGSKG